MKTAATRGRPKKDAQELESRNEIILAQACRAFARHGFANMDVEELAGELGIGKGTVYRAFPSKQELFAATLSRSLEQLGQFLTEAVDAQNTAAIPRIQVGVRAFLRFFDQNPDVIELLIQERAVAQLESSAFRNYCLRNNQRWERFFDELIKEGLIRQVEAKWLGETLNQLLFGQLFLHRLSDSKNNLESRSEDILRLFFVGILTDKGLRSAGLPKAYGDLQ